MKESTRIIINTLATYGGSLVGLVVGLFSARWILLALGQTDFGLYGVIGSIVIMMSFLNQGMSVGVARFYAYSIGRGHNLSSEEANDDLKRWFNTALGIHITLPLLLILIGYPIGVYAINHWLVIPPDRAAACVWVFRISLVSSFVGMASVPFNAMYTAHQYIAELTLFGLVYSAGIFMTAYSLLTVQSDRLIFYALCMMAISAGIPLLQVVRAVFKFKACRVHVPYLFNRKYLKELFSYVGWKMFGLSCVVFRTQGSPVLVNLFFGPQVNAAYTVANSLSIQATTLSSAMMGAFQPAITSMEGRGHREKMLETALQVCKFGTLLVLLFVIPLMLEMKTVLELWLINPPEYAGPLCQWMLVMLVIDRITAGQMLAVNAYGKIAAYELVQGTILFLALPLTWLLFKVGSGPVSIGYALVFTMALYCVGRLQFCKWLLKMSVSEWFKKVAVPVFMLSVCSVATGFSITQMVDAGFFRICLTTVVTGVCSAGIGWFCLLNWAERSFVRESINKVAVRFKSSCKFLVIP